MVARDDRKPRAAPKRATLHAPDVRVCPRTGRVVRGAAAAGRSAHALAHGILLLAQARGELVATEGLCAHPADAEPADGMGHVARRQIRAARRERDRDGAAIPLVTPF